MLILQKYPDKSENFQFTVHAHLLLFLAYLSLFRCSLFNIAFVDLLGGIHHLLTFQVGIFKEFLVPFYSIKHF